MKTEQIIILVVAFFLGMLLLNMVKNVCGCGVKEGFSVNELDTGPTLPTTRDFLECNKRLNVRSDSDCVISTTSYGDGCNYLTPDFCPGIESVISGRHCEAVGADDLPSFRQAAIDAGAIPDTLCPGGGDPPACDASPCQGETYSSGETNCTGVGNCGNCCTPCEYNDSQSDFDWCAGADGVSVRGGGADLCSDDGLWYQDVSPKAESAAGGCATQNLPVSCTEYCNSKDYSWKPDSNFDQSSSCPIAENVDCNTESVPTPAPATHTCQSSDGAEWDGSERPAGCQEPAPTTFECPPVTGTQCSGDDVCTQDGCTGWTTLTDDDDDARAIKSAISTMQQRAVNFPLTDNLGLTSTQVAALGSKYSAGTKFGYIPHGSYSTNARYCRPITGSGGDLPGGLGHWCENPEGGCPTDTSWPT